MQPSSFKTHKIFLTFLCILRPPQNKVLAMLNAVMIDLETFSTEVNAVVTSIGAVVFDPRNREAVDMTYLDFLPVQQQIDAGRRLDYGSLRFWILQSGGARKSNFSDDIAKASESKDLDQALHDFRNFVSLVAQNIKVPQASLELWSNGPAFDEAILRALYESRRIEFPFAYNAGRDFRTIARAAYPKTGRVPLTIPKDSVKHNALDDAKWQAEGVKMCYAKLYSRQKGD